jgi:hypothetical protein
MNFGKHIIKSNTSQILFAIAVFGALCWYALKGPAYAQSISWMEAICGVGVLLMTVFIWFNNLKRDWEAILPKRVTVYFQYQGRDVMIAKQMPLTSEGDIRGWSQQIGRKMNKDKDISVKTWFKYENLGPDKSQSFFEYRITYYLNEVPENLLGLLGYNSTTLPEKMCLVWQLIKAPDGSYNVEEGTSIASEKLT